MQDIQQLACVLYRGDFGDKDDSGFIVDDDASNKAVSLLTSVTSKDPFYIFDLLDQFLSDGKDINDMFIIFLCCSISFIENILPIDKIRIIDFLKDMNSSQLLLITKLFKQKAFNRKGLSSSIQKIIRHVIEKSWEYSKLEQEIVLQNRQLFSLLRLIHPRFSGKKSDFIKEVYFK